jgi:hypothetical protein
MRSAAHRRGETCGVPRCSPRAQARPGARGFYFFSASRISRSSSTSSGVGAGGGGGGGGLALQAVDLPHHHEDDEGQDDEVQATVMKLP